MLVGRGIPDAALAAPPSGAGEDDLLDAARVAGPESQSATDVGTAGSRVVIDVQVVVDYGVPIHAVAAAVRARIAAHIAEQTGLVATEVSVAVVDVQLPRTPPSTGAGE